MSERSLRIHQLDTLDDLKTAVRLQQQIWGFEDVDLLPLRMFVVASKIGGQILGAFDIGKMIAFCLCVPGLKPGGAPYLHSHMLGVLPEYRNTGVGRSLKLAQREYAIQVGTKLIEWTFDPLEIKNAFFNIERLGAIARRYVHNQYGATSSHLHGGLPTDRLVAEWWIQSPRVLALSQGQPVKQDDIQARVSVPAGMVDIKAQDPQRARAIQSSVGDQFFRCFRDGLTVTGFQKEADVGTYLLSQWQSR